MIFIAEQIERRIGESGPAELILAGNEINTEALHPGLRRMPENRGDRKAAEQGEGRIRQLAKSGVDSGNGNAKSGNRGGGRIVGTGGHQLAPGSWKWMMD